MPDYRRNRVAGGTFFFAANLLDRRSDLLVTQIDALRDAARRVRARAPLHIDAWVVLPDHMHCLWTPASVFWTQHLRRGRLLPEGDADLPGRWRAIKKGFSKSMRIGEPRSPVMILRVNAASGSDDTGHTIRDDPRLREGDLAAHLDCIHFNPVKHGLIEHPGECRIPPFAAAWPGGEYPAGWIGGGEPPETGERR